MKLLKWNRRLSQRGVDYLVVVAKWCVQVLMLFMNVYDNQRQKRLAQTHSFLLCNNEAFQKSSIIVAQARLGPKLQFHDATALLNP